jgi:hypothetical protein
MIEAIVRALLYLCGIALCFFLIVWVIGEIGIVIPAMVLHILMVMFVLLAILVLYRLLWPWVGGNFWGPGPGPRP